MSLASLLAPPEASPASAVASTAARTPRRAQNQVRHGAGRECGAGSETSSRVVWSSDWMAEKTSMGPADSSGSGPDSALSASSTSGPPCPWPGFPHPLPELCGGPRHVDLPERS